VHRRAAANWRDGLRALVWVISGRDRAAPNGRQSGLGPAPAAAAPGPVRPLICCLAGKVVASRSARWRGGPVAQSA